MTVLSLALVILLSAAPPDAPRIPGTRFRLGMTTSQIAGIGAYAEAKVPDAGGMTARQGPSRFFGIPGEVTLYLWEGSLARLKFVATGVSPHSAGYAEDQLRRMGLGRQCLRETPGDRACDWLGGAVKVRVEVREDRLEARAERWPAQAWAAADTLRAAGLPGAGDRRASDPRPAPGGPAGAPAVGAAAGRDSPATKVTASGPAAGGPATAPPPLAPGGTRAPSAPDTVPPRAPGATPAVPTAVPDSAPQRSPGGTAVATLPETLTLSLAARNSPDEWPRIVSSPALEYPEAARRESVQGVVWVLALVDSDGRVLEATIHRGIRELDTAALAWVSRARFAPCTLQGQPCRFRVRVAVLFTLY